MSYEKYVLYKAFGVERLIGNVLQHYEGNKARIRICHTFRAVAYIFICRTIYHISGNFRVAKFSRVNISCSYFFIDFEDLDFAAQSPCSW